MKDYRLIVRRRDPSLDSTVHLCAGGLRDAIRQAWRTIAPAHAHQIIGFTPMPTTDCQHRPPRRGGQHGTTSSAQRSGLD